MIKALIRISGAFLLTIIMVVFALFLFQPRIPLGKLAAPVSELLTSLTGREQIISGDFVLVPGNWMTLSVQNGRFDLTGSEAFKLKAEIESAQITVSFWSLFTGQINLDGITVHGAVFDILAAGESNKSEPRIEPLPFSLQQTGSINLADITVSLSLRKQQTQINFYLEKIKGEGGSIMPGQLSIRAAVDGREFEAEIKVGSLAGLTEAEADWPFSLVLNYKSVTAEVNGALAGLVTAPELIADISLYGEHFDDLSSVFGWQASTQQPFVLQGSMALSAEELHAQFSTLQPGTEDLLVTVSVQEPASQEPQYHISLQGEFLDLDALKTLITSAAPGDIHSAARVTNVTRVRNDSLFPEPFPVSNLSLELDLKELRVAGNTVRDIRLDAFMHEGIVETAPVSLIFFNTSLAGHFSLNLASRVPQFSTCMTASTFNVGELLAEAQRADGMVMHIDQIRMELESQGKTPGELLDNLALNIQAGTGMYEHHDPDTGAMLPVLLQQAKISAAPGEQTELQIEASFRDSPIAMILQGAPLAELVAAESDWPFTIQMNHKSVNAKVNGTMTNLLTEPVVTADVSISGEHFDDLSAVLGFHTSTKQAFALQGRTTLSAEELRADISRLQPGTDELLLSVSRNTSAVQKPLYKVAVKGKRLDLDALKNFFTPEVPLHTGSEDKTKRVRISREDVIFPGTFPVQNLSLQFDLKELIIAGDKMKNIRLDTAMHDGIIDKAPFSVNFINSSLAGHFSLDFAASVPQLSVHLLTRTFNVGEFLRQQRLAEDIFMQIENMQTDLSTRGRTLGELADNLVLDIHARDGIYEYHDPNTGAVLPIVLNQSKISMAPGVKTELSMETRIENEPVHIALEFENIRQKKSGSGKDVAFVLHAHLADTSWELNGTIPLPYRRKGITLHNRLAGSQLSNLNNLLHLQLPDIGPFAINGLLSIVDSGYRLNGIEVQIGSSTLTGHVSVDTTAIPPAINIELEAQKIQLDDFREIRMDSKDAVAGKQEQKQTSEAEQQQPYLTDQSVLDRYNASIRIDVNEVLSGNDYLGNGMLKIEQQQGRFMLEPLQLNLRNGSIYVDFSIEPSAHEHLYHLNILINDLDYGIAGRWFKTDSDISGILDLRAVLVAKSPDLTGLMANASGYFDFSLQPGKLQSGIIDLWATNLLINLFSLLTPGGESKVNCAAGRFNLDKGILADEDILIDTTRIQVEGNVEVDFNRRWIKALLKPVPKRPQFLSLATPIRINGPLADFHVGVSPGGAIGTVVRLFTAYIVVPVQWVTKKPVPADGTSACLQLFDARQEKTKRSSPKDNATDPNESSTLLKTR